MLQNRLTLLLISIIFLIAVVYQIGPNFFANFTNSLPSDPISGHSTIMVPGDHHEQFYRYTLVKRNIINSHSLYYNGYQFASSEKIF